MSFNLTQKIALNATISSAARVIELAISLVIIGLITRHLGENGFGDYATILAFVYIFTVLADLGLYSIVVREISREGADEEKILNNALTLRMFAGLIILGLAYFVSLLFPYPSQIQIGIAIAAFGFWFLSNTQVLMGLFQKHLRLDKVALAELAGRMIQLAVVWIVVYYSVGAYCHTPLHGIVAAVAIGAIFNFLIILYFASGYIKLKPRFNFSYWKYLLKQSFPLAISAILVMIYFKLDTIFLSVMKTSEAVGVYSLSYKILESLIFFPAMIVGLTMPLMSKTFLIDRQKFYSIIQRTLNFLVIIIVPLIIGTLFTSEKIIRLIGGARGFADSPMVLNILVFAIAMIFLGALFSNVIIAANKQKFLAQIYFIGAVVNVIANFIFIPKYSYYGAAATTVLTELLVTALMIAVIVKTINFFPSFKIFFKALFASGAMALALVYSSDLNIFYLLIVGIAVYFPILYLIGGISKEELKKLRN